jgi:hypothetical protein
LALPGTQQAPRRGNLLLRVRDEQPVKPKRHERPLGLYLCASDIPSLAP